MPQEEKMAVSKKTTSKVKKNHRNQKTYPLEPVLEDCVAPVYDADKRPEQCPFKDVKKLGKSKNVLSKLRDKYVRLMNDMASGSDLTGASAMYGCSSIQADYPGTAAMASIRAREHEEMKQALRFQQALSK